MTETEPPAEPVDPVAEVVEPPPAGPGLLAVLAPWLLGVGLLVAGLLVPRLPHAALAVPVALPVLWLAAGVRRGTGVVPLLRSRPTLVVLLLAGGLYGGLPHLLPADAPAPVGGPAPAARPRRTRRRGCRHRPRRGPRPPAGAQRAAGGAARVGALRAEA